MKESGGEVFELKKVAGSSAVKFEPEGFRSVLWILLSSAQQYVRESEPASDNLFCFHSRVHWWTFLSYT